MGLAVEFSLPGESVLISDGGLATELEARGHDLSGPLWSAKLLAGAPREITAVHAEFFRAGATIATTAQGIDRDETVGLLRRSVELAKVARDQDVLTAIGIADVGKPVIVYPNSGQRWDSRRRT